MKLFAIAVFVASAGCAVDAVPSESLAHSSDIYLKLDGVAGETSDHGRPQHVVSFELVASSDTASVRIADDCFFHACRIVTATATLQSGAATADGLVSVWRTASPIGSQTHMLVRGDPAIDTRIEFLIGGSGGWDDAMLASLVTCVPDPLCTPIKGRECFPICTPN